MTRVWLVRHGEVASYHGDHGLTERGTAQARAAAAELAGELGGAGAVGLRHATSARAAATAAELAAGLREAGVPIGEPVPDPGFDNFRVQIDGRIEPHDRMRPALAELGDAADPPPPWAAEVGRFVAIHDGGADPIDWWLVQPTLAMESASVVVRRMWRALLGLRDAGEARVVVSTHSASMRALAAHALGDDPGEPANLERVHVDLDGTAARLTYRGREIRLAVPELEEPAWS